MMKRTEQLIGNLTGKLEPVKPAMHPAVPALIWVVGSALYVSAFLCFSGIRADIGTKLFLPLFIAEIATLGLLVLSSALSVALLSFPDMYQKRWVLFTPLIAAGLFCAVLLAQWLLQSPLEPQPSHGLECLKCIAFLSVLPAAAIFYYLRKQATVHANLAGAAALLAASGIGCLGLRLSEQTDSITHIVQWHYLPMTGFALAGVLIGQKLLKW